MEFLGHLLLEAEACPRKGTRLARQACGGPFHVGKPYWDSEVMQVQVVNPTAGMLEGDCMTMHVQAGPGARLCVTTPAASRAFKVAGAGRVSLTQQLSVAAGAWLEYAPEPLYPHAGADYFQRTVLALESGAEACVVDSLAPGRAARGELWEWKRLCNQLEVSRNRIPLLRERLDMTGAQLSALAKAHGFGEAWFATVLVASERLPAEAAWWETLSGLQGEGLSIGITSPVHGFHVLRVVASSGQKLRDTLALVRGHLATVLTGLRTNLRRL